MVKISKEFNEEVRFISRINEKNFRKLNWVIVPKEDEYSDWGNEIHGKDDIPELQIFSLHVTSDIGDKFAIVDKNTHLYALEEPLTSSELAHIEIEIIDDIEETILKERCPVDVDIDEETDPDDYMTQEERHDVSIKAKALAVQKIAEKMVERTRAYFNLNNTPIRIYAGDTLLISALQANREKEIKKEQYKDR